MRRLIALITTLLLLTQLFNNQATAQSAQYGDLVWIDTNQDGIMDSGEVGLNGVRVELYLDNGDGVPDPTTDALERFTLTSGGGAYLFGALPIGDYFAVFYVPPTYSVSPADQGGNDALDSDATMSGSLNGWETAITPITSITGSEWELYWDLGIYQPSPGVAAVGNYVWYDLNGNGVQDESTSEGLNGITVNIYESANPGTIVQTTVTQTNESNNAGYYLFDDLTPGNYFLEFVLPSGATFTSNGGSNSNTNSDVNPATGQTGTITLIENSFDQSIDAGIEMPTGNLTLGDRVWFETDNDGIYESGETGINQVKVELYMDTDNNGAYTPGVDDYYTSTVTYTASSVPGYYEFNNLPPGDYIVVIPLLNFGNGEALDGYSSTTGGGSSPNNNTDNNDDGTFLNGYGVVSQAITLSNGGEPSGGGNTNLTLDFGFFEYPCDDTPVAVITTEGEVCDDDIVGSMSINLQSLITSGYTSGTWNDDDGSGGLSGTTFTYTTSMGAGPFHFTYTIPGTDNNGPPSCQDRNYTVTISVITCEVVCSTSTPSLIVLNDACDGETISLSPLTQDGQTLTWYDRATNTAVPNPSSVVVDAPDMCFGETVRFYAPYNFDTGPEPDCDGVVALEHAVHVKVFPAIQASLDQGSCGASINCLCPNYNISWSDNMGNSGTTPAYNGNNGFAIVNFTVTAEEPTMSCQSTGFNAIINCFASGCLADASSVYPLSGNATCGLSQIELVNTSTSPASYNYYYFLSDDSGNIVTSITPNSSIDVSGLPDGDYCAYGVSTNPAVTLNTNVTTVTGLDASNSGCYEISPCYPISISDAPSVSISSAASCGSNGTFSISFTASGGSGDYNIILFSDDPNYYYNSLPANNGTPVNFSGVPSGTYTVSIVDNATGCETTDALSFSEICDNTSPQCTISIASVTPSTCNPATNTYSIDVALTYGDDPGGNININGELFASNGSGTQTFTINNLVADGASGVDVTAFFVNESSCTYTLNNAYNAPADCTPACAIEVVSATASACNPATNTYSVEVNVTYSNNPSGNININGELFASNGSGNQTFTINNLVADGTSGVDVTAFFVNESSCTHTLNNAYNAPANCEPNCSISITSVTPSTCDENTDTYSLEIQFSYIDYPGGDIQINSNVFSGVTTTPDGSGTHTLTINGIPADGTQNIDVTAFFVNENTCTTTMTDAYDAPESCSIECDITIVSATPSACNPANNKYSLDVVVSYINSPGGNIFVNGQVFPSDGSGSQTFTLQNLTANGATDINVTVRFLDESSCQFTLADAYDAPASCESTCSLSIDSVTPSACNGTDNTYSLEMVVSYVGYPGGEIQFDSDIFSGVIVTPDGTGTYSVTINNLNADGTQDIDVSAFFINEPSCSATVVDAFDAPAFCGVNCFITIDSVVPSACNPANNKYTLDVTVSYYNSPGGNIFVNGQTFPSDGSGTETFTLQNLTANGATDLNVTARFVDETSCSYTMNDAYNAPASCETSCDLTITSVTPTTCDDATGTYDLEIVMDYVGYPGGNLQIDSEAFPSIVITPDGTGSYTLTVNSLPANEQQNIDVSAFFTSESACSASIVDAYDAPAYCGDLCYIMIDSVVPSACNPANNKYTLEVTVTYYNSPGGDIFINGQVFPSDGSGNETFTLQNLTANGATDLNVTARFNNDTSCQFTLADAYDAPASCESACDLTITSVTPSACNETDGTYSLEIVMDYVGYPGGNIQVDSDIFSALITTPNGTGTHTLTVNGLISDALQDIDVSAFFVNEPACSASVVDAFDAPAFCGVNCYISIESVVPSVCNPANNFYTLDVTVNYYNSPGGDVFVNGQVFPSDGSGTETFTLQNLTANGATDLDVTTRFINESSCQFTLADAYDAPSSCETACDLTITSVTPSACNEVDGTYSLDIVIDYVGYPGGNLQVDSDIFSGEITTPDGTGSHTCTVTGLLSNNQQNIDVSAFFVSEPACTANVVDAYDAPAYCGNLCNMEIISVTPSACNPANNYYTLDVEVTYYNYPGGDIFVNGQIFPVDGSGNETFTLVNLTPNGLTDVDVTSRFVDEPTCTYTLADAYDAPTGCATDCSLNIVSVTPSACNSDDNFYSLEIVIDYLGYPGGSIQIDTDVFTGVLTIPDGTGTHTVNINGISSYGQEDIDVTAFFVGQPDCSDTKINSYDAPTTCGTACLINIESVNVSTCDMATNFYTLEVELSYANSPGGNIFINGQVFTPDGSGLETFILNNLSSNGATNVDVTAKFLTENSCQHVFLDAYNAPESCNDTPPCLIYVEDVRPSLCDPNDNTYDLEVDLQYYNAPTNNGVQIWGEAFTTNVFNPIAPDFQTITIAGLTANGLQGMDITAAFVDDISCAVTVVDAYDAPANCNSDCSLTVLSATPGTCDPITNMYSLNVEVLYFNVPAGNIDIGGQVFSVDGSGQEIFTLTNLDSTGDVNLDVTAFFVDTPSCTHNLVDAYDAPQVCNPNPICTINILSVTPSACNPDNNQYAVAVEFEYTNPPGGDIQFDSNVFTGAVYTPLANYATVTFVISGLNSDGTNDIDLNAFFINEPTCDDIVVNAYDAPMICDGSCELTFEGITVSECDAETNTYTVNVGVSYLNANPSNININGQLFTPDGSGNESFILTNLPADGTNNIDLTAVFVDDNTCGFLIEDAYDAPPTCNVAPPCALNIVSATPSACDPTDNTYTLEVLFTLTNAPDPSNIQLESNVFAPLVLSPAAGATSYIATLTGLASNGLQNIDLTAWFINEPSCMVESVAAYDAPLPCNDDCSITVLSATPSACDPITNLYSVDVELSYVNPPGLNVQISGQNFVLDGSGYEVITLMNLNADGQTGVDVFAIFFDDTSCQHILQDAYDAPAECNENPACVLNLVYVSVPACDIGEDTHSLYLSINYAHQPAGDLQIFLDDLLIVSFTPDGSGLLNLTINGFPNDGTPDRDITVSFANDTDCSDTMVDAYNTPSSYTEGEERPNCLPFSIIKTN